MRLKTWGRGGHSYGISMTTSILNIWVIVCLILLRYICTYCGTNCTTFEQHIELTKSCRMRDYHNFEKDEHSIDFVRN